RLVGIGGIRDAAGDLREFVTLLGGGAAPPPVAVERVRRIRREAGVAADEPRLRRRAPTRIKAGAPAGFPLRPVGGGRRPQGGLSLARFCRRPPRKRILYPGWRLRYNCQPR